MFFDPKVGDRVELFQDVEKFPIGVFPAGTTGEVVEKTEDYVSVRLDVEYPELSEWNNELIWNKEHDDTNVDNFWSRFVCDVRVIRPKPSFGR